MEWVEVVSSFDPATRSGAILLGIAASVILLGLQKILKWLQLLVSNFMLFNLSAFYSLSGYWYSYEIKDSKLHRLNFNKIIQKKQKVSFHVWQYSTKNTVKPYERYYSEGIMKGNHLSAFFFSGDKNSPETGAFICKQEGQKLVGKYIQYSVENDVAELLSSPDNYCLNRIHLPFKNRLRMLFAQSPFKSKEEAFAFMDNQDNIIKWRE